MYSKQDAARIRQEFWTSLGKYMQPIPDHEFQAINWINYRTGKKAFSVRSNSQGRLTTVMLEIVSTDELDRSYYFDILQQHRSFLEHAEAWQWGLDLKTDERSFAGLMRTLEGPSIMDRSQWPEIISFLKASLIELDAFWGIVKEFVD